MDCAAGTRLVHMPQQPSLLSLGVETCTSVAWEEGAAGLWSPDWVTPPASQRLRSSYRSFCALSI
jgi:hypothetical protein